MPMIDLTQGTSLVDYILYAFMAGNLLLSGSFLIHRGVQKVRAMR